jgi:ribosomal protein L21
MYAVVVELDQLERREERQVQREVGDMGRELLIDHIKMDLKPRRRTARKRGHKENLTMRN